MSLSPGVARKKRESSCELRKYPALSTLYTLDIFRVDERRVEQYLSELGGVF